MSTAEDDFEQLRVRGIWEHEALDFTPWLAGNLDLLGRELDMELELVQTEKPIGPLFLDILAKEVNTGEMVAIENQLEWSDRGHLAQLITYAAGCNARVGIWVATEFTQELANALYWLNQCTRDDIRFYGVKVQVIRKRSESRPEPRFHKVVHPGGWDKSATLPPDPPPPPHVKKYKDFFEPLVDELIRGNFADRADRLYGHSGRYFPSRLAQGVSYAASLEGKNDAWVAFHIQTGNNQLTKGIFDELLAQRDDIEARIDTGPDTEWHWRRHDRWTFSSICVRKDGNIDDAREKLTETRAWMLDLLVKFKESFDPRVAEILARLS